MAFFDLPKPTYGFTPLEDAQEELRRAMLAGSTPVQPDEPAAPASVLPRTRKASAGGAVTNSVKPGAGLGSGRSVLTQALDMYNKEPDMAAINEYAQKRAGEGDSSMLNAIAAQFAGPGFEGVQANYLKRAMASQDPMKFGNYGYLAGGKFVADPFAGRDAKAEALLNVGGKLLDNEEAAARDARLSARMNAGNNRLQQGSTFLLPGGQVVQGMFDPNRGYVYSTPQGLVPIPNDARPTTPSVGNPLSQKDFIKMRDEQRTENVALQKLNNYFATVQSSDVGFQRLAAQVSANAKTLFGSGLSPDELAAQVGRGQLQGLLGLFRETVVGPGVMTEQDAQRVLNALGGDFNSLQNPQAVEALLRDLYQSKYSRVQFLDGELRRSNDVYGESGVPITVPSTLGGQSPQAGPVAPGGPRKVVVDF